jgi:CBS domain-containing protein
MARLRSPLVAVVKGGRLIGVITASRVLEAALRP